MPCRFFFLRGSSEIRSFGSQSSVFNHTYFLKDEGVGTQKHIAMHAQLKDTAAIADASKKWTRTQNSRLLMIITVGVGTCDKRSEFGAVIRVSKRIQESVTEFLPVRNGEAIFSDSAALACSIFEYKR